MSVSTPSPDMMSEGDRFLDSLNYEPDFDEDDSTDSTDIDAVLDSLPDVSEGEDTAIVDTQNEEKSKQLREIEDVKMRAREMADEEEMIKQVQAGVQKLIGTTGMQKPSIKGQLNLSIQTMLDSDNRSVYVGNVDYGTTKTELEEHFKSCGPIIRVTIVCDHFSGHPKGLAYIEFKYADSCKLAKALNDTLFRGRQIKVNSKRTNRPGLSTTDRAPRGRFFRGAGSGQPARGSRPQGSTWSSTSRGSTWSSTSRGSTWSSTSRGSTWSSRSQGTTRHTPY